jgi:hypothetical protein
MGCDIHAHVEIKVSGKWYHYNHPKIDRYYELFARMANVRNNGSIEPISEPRGLPEDITFTTRYDRNWDGVDGHSDSWLSAKEVADLGKWVEAKRKEFAPKVWYSFEHHDVGYIFGNGWDDCERRPKGYEDARLVFWFDN